MGVDVDSWGPRDHYAAEEDPNVRYVIILVEGQRLPHAVVRLTGTVEEAFGHELRWEPSDLLSRVESEPSWTAREANVGYANGFLVEMIRVLRACRHESELADYKYYASFKHALGVLDLDNADRLIRRPEGSVEEEYAGHGTWERSDKLHRIDSGHDPDEAYVAISESEALRLKELIDDRWDRGCSHHVVFVDRDPVAVVVKVCASPDDELACTGEAEPQPSRLLDQAAREPRMNAVEVGMEKAVEMMAALARRRRLRDQAALTGGFAVFDSLTDVLDPDAATEVVPAREDRQRISAPLSPREAERIGLRLHVRQARRTAEAVRGHHHFAVFSRLEDVVDPVTATSVIRVDPHGHWEMYLRGGVWPRTPKPSRLITLPLDGSGLDRVTRALDDLRPRYFEVRGPQGRVALLRLTGSTEESARDLRWEPSALLSRRQDEPDRVITEYDEEAMTLARYHRASSERAERHRGDACGYFAVFADFAAALDFRRAEAVVRREDGVDERHVERGRWVPTDLLSRNPDVPYLAVSEAEAERLRQN